MCKPHSLLGNSSYTCILDISLTLGTAYFRVCTSITFFHRCLGSFGTVLFSSRHSRALWHPTTVSVAAKTSFLFHINKNNFLLQARVPSIRPALKAKSLSSSLASPLMLESVIIRIQQRTGILLFVINYWSIG